MRWMRASPNSSSWGSTVMTSRMEVRVPRPRVRPTEPMVASVEMPPMRNPATAMMEPEVRMVGKLWLRDSTTACRGSMTVLSSR